MQTYKLENPYNLRISKVFLGRLRSSSLLNMMTMHVHLYPVRLHFWLLAGAITMAVLLFIQINLYGNQNPMTGQHLSIAAQFNDLS